jgi:hypothetical protein
MNVLNLRFIIKLWRNDRTVKIYHSRKIRRIYAILKADNFQKAYLKVLYGRATTNREEIEEIYNDGDYESKEELLFALSSFTEKDLIDDTQKWIEEG